MNAKKIKVLLIRSNQSAHSPLMDRLGRSGCECELATSHEKVGALLDDHGFDLVLGPIKMDSDSLYPLIGILNGSRATLFLSQPVEHGCWWLPALWRGVNCFGAPAYRPSEFVTVLDKTIEAIRSSVRMTVETQAPMAPGYSRSAVSLPNSRSLPVTELPPAAFASTS
jgi:hypothetical protein